jgi:hypothetical protein
MKHADFFNEENRAAAKAAREKIQEAQKKLLEESRQRIATLHEEWLKARG